MLKLVFGASLALALTAPVLMAATTQEPPLPSPVLSSGFTFTTAPYPEVHASTIVETHAGTILAAWFGGTKERNPDVEIYVSRMSGGAWQPAVSVATGVQPDGVRLPTWNPVLFQPKNGPISLFYKVGPSPSTWWGMVMTSADDGRSWSKPRRLPDGILGPVKNKPVELPDGTWLSPSSTEKQGNRWSLHFERSSDGGESWRTSAPVDSPEGIDAIQPSILLHKGGQLQAVARTREGVVASSWSKDGGVNWSALSAIDLPNPNSGTDAVTLTDGRQLIVYNHSAHSLGRSNKGFRHPINVAISDDGMRWRKVLTLESRPLDAGYAYPAVIQARDGRVHITYTWDRKRIRHIILDPARLPRGDWADKDAVTGP